MSLFGKGGLFGGKDRVHDEMVIGLTSLGAAKAESLSGPGGIKGQILLMLKDAGPSSISDIAEEIHISSDKVKAVAKTLIANGYVRKVSGD